MRGANKEILSPIHDSRQIPTCCSAKDSLEFFLYNMKFGKNFVVVRKRNTPFFKEKMSGVE